MSKNTSNQLGVGGGPNGPKRWVPGQIVHQTYHDKTGCRLATDQEEKRLGQLQRYQGEWRIKK